MLAVGCIYPDFKGKSNIYVVQSNFREMISAVVQLVRWITLLTTNTMDLH